MCQLFALVVAVSAMIGKPAQPLTTLEVKPDGHFALDEKKDTDSVNAAAQSMLPNSLVQNKQESGFDRGQTTADQVTKEDTAAFDDEIKDSRMTEIPPDFRAEHQGIGDLIKSPALVEEENDAAVDAAVENVADIVADVAAENHDTEAKANSIENTEAAALSLQEQQRHATNQLYAAFVMANQQANQLTSANTQLKGNQVTQQAASASLAEEQGRMESKAILDGVSVSDVQVQLNSKLTVAEAKMGTIKDSLENLYKRAYEKTSMINKITETLKEYVGQMDTQQTLGSEAIGQLVETMRGVAQYGDAKRAADDTEKAANGNP